MKHNSFILPATIFFALVLGGVLYVVGGPELYNLRQAQLEEAESFSVVAEGTGAVAISQRVNYRIKNTEDFATLWTLIYGQNVSTPPAVDFSKREVLAIFNGSHSTTGYRVSVVDVEDTNEKRIVKVLREEPGPSCSVQTQVTSPFILVSVPTSFLPIERIEEVVVLSCR